MARITIKNWTDETITFKRDAGGFSMAPRESDYWHIHSGSVKMTSPTPSGGFHAEEGDRYIVFKDYMGFYRFAYIGKDGYVAKGYNGLAPFEDVTDSQNVLSRQGEDDPFVNSLDTMRKSDC
jgi:hypothetical protein